MIHCPCIALSHGHEPGHCDEPAPASGSGTCPTCRYHDHQPMPNHAVREAVGTSNLPFPARLAVYKLLDQ